MGDLPRPVGVPAPYSAGVNPLSTSESPPIEAAPILRAWERLPREGDAAWSLFLGYRDSAYPQGPNGTFVPRKLSHYAQATGFSSSYIHDLSSSFKWSERAGAYDRALDLAKAEADFDDVKLMRSRHLRILGKGRTVLEKELDKLITRSEAEDASLQPREMIKLLEVVIRNERLLHGEVTDKVGVDGAWDLSKLTFEELQELAALRDKTGGGG